MKFGIIISTARKEKNLEIKFIADEIRIKKQYLLAFENEDFWEMPKDPFGLGFLDKYLQYLDIPEREEILLIYKEKKEGANSARYLVKKEEIDSREDLKNKVK